MTDLTTMYIWWSVGLFVSALLLPYLFALFSTVSRSGRLEQTILTAYLFGVILHLITTITLATIYLVIPLVDLSLYWTDITLYNIGVLVIIIIDIIFIITLNSNLKELPKI